MVRALSSIATTCITVTLSGWLVFSGCSMSQDFQPFDEDKLVLMQFQEMVPGEDIALIETSMGEFTMRFFPSEAPKTVENFIELAQEGYFDGKPINKVEIGVDVENNPTGRLIAGAQEWKAEQKEKIPKGKSVYETRQKEELSYNLAHFPGAVSAYTNDGAVDSRFFIVGERKICQTEINQMEANQYPKKIIEGFKRKGGYPEYWLKSSIFAQVIQGINVVDEIIISGKSDTAEEIIINQVTIKKYGDE